MWKEVVRKMSGKYDLVVPDLRGESGVRRRRVILGIRLSVRIVCRIWKEL